jgi:hypothetical protein
MDGFLPFWCSLWFPCFDLPPPLLIWASFWFRLQILWNPVASYGNRFLAPCFPRLRKFFLFRPALHVLETGLCVFFKTFPTICGARVFPPSDEWNVVDVSIQFLVTGHTLSLHHLTVYFALHTLGHYLLTRMSSSVPSDELYNKILNLVVCRVNVLCVKV